MLKDRQTFAPFGWAVSCAGRKPAQVRTDVRTAVEHATQRFESYFPAERGYEVSALSPAGASNGVQLQVRRGNFRATVAIEAILDPNRKAPDERAIRMYGRAESEALVAAEKQGHQIVRRLRSAGVGLGTVGFCALLWICIGANSPFYVLGGLLMVVAALLAVTLGASLGSWLGERIADSDRCRALAIEATDPAFQDDLRRWRALSRQLASQRLALSGRVGPAPFRALPAATSAFSFSF